MAIVTSKPQAVRADCDQWQFYVKTAIRDISQLCRVLQVSQAELGQADAVAQGFSTFVPQPYLRRIVPGDPLDPVLLQVLPQSIEGRAVDGFVPDAVGDCDATIAQGVIRKYAGRALLIASGACAIHCRYCFRRHFPYDAAPLSAEQWRSALATIDRDPSISEIILSGGDPLMLVDSRLAELICMIEALKHVKRLRIHTRLPVVIPQRVNPNLLQILQNCRMPCWVVIHANHPRELDEDVKASIRQLVNAGVPVLNQSVLLRRVNDDVATLVSLSEQLLEARCTPYYLHQLDRVAGTAHFEVPVAHGQRLVAEMRQRLPGYAVPRYVQEVAGELSKKVLA